jgi:hypothetical protein
MKTRIALMAMSAGQSVCRKAKQKRGQAEIAGARQTMQDALVKDAPGKGRLR